MVCLAGGAAFYFFHIKKKPAMPAPPVVSMPQPKAVVPVTTNPVAPPKLVAVTTNKPPPAAPPHASDKFWTLALDGEKTPGSGVVGRIHGRDFRADRAWYKNGELHLRTGTNGSPEFGARIDFGVLPDALTNKTINVSATVDQAATVVLLWNDNGVVQKEFFKGGYALRLEDGVISKNLLIAKLYLCTPDEGKSYLMGKCYAYIVKPKPPAKPAPSQPAPPKKKS